MSDWSGPRRGQIWKIVGLSAAAVVLVAGGYFAHALRGTSASGGSASAAATSAGGTPTVAPVPAGESVFVPEVGKTTPDGGAGWSAPQAGRGHGPTARSADGVPSGYTQDAAGAGVAAVNAVVGGLWFGTTMTDPWKTLGFLAADPAKIPSASQLSQQAADGAGDVRWLLGVHSTGLVVNHPPLTSGDVPTTTAPGTVVVGGSPVFGAAVLGVTADLVTADGVTSAQASVLWETFGDNGTGDGGSGSHSAVRLYTLSLQLVWQDGDWKVATFDRSSYSKGTLLSATVNTGRLPTASWAL